MARPMPPVSPCAPWLCSGTSTPTGLVRAATTRRGARRSTTSMASSITPTGSTTCSSPPPWEGENYEPRNPMESGKFDGLLRRIRENGSDILAWNIYQLNSYVSFPDEYKVKKGDESEQKATALMS